MKINGGKEYKVKNIETNKDMKVEIKEEMGKWFSQPKIKG